MRRGISNRGLAGIAPSGNQQPATTALLNNLWGREKIKFDHLGKTKDLATAPGTPQGADRSIFLNSILPAGFVLPVAGPAVGKTTLRPGFASSANSLILAVSLQGDAGHEITPPGRSEK